ncbi:hypothetical protein [Streptomyces sp. DH1]|uniref:hypothetical protein n=1 Tax=Streptomyces sp. DH1 TaxID=2857012 RepID=UPI001E33D96C|nr:hypothetical protein [Streptomyces sp. DH1]
MAAVSLETTELETLIETCLTNPRVGMQVLNAFRVENGKAAHPANYGPGDLTRPHDSAWRAALSGVQADLAV